MSYSQALETQMSALRFMESPAGLRASFEQQQFRLRFNEASPSAEHIQIATVRDLEQADTFYVEPSICELVEIAAWSLPASALLQAAMVPGIKGFVHLARPLTVPSGWWGRDIEVIAFHWGVYGSYRPDPTTPAPTELVAGDAAVLRAEDYLGDGIDITWYARHGGDVVPIAGVAWDIGAPWGGWLKEDRTGREVNQEHDQCRRFTLAFFAFISQRILVDTTETPERATRKRAATVWAGAPQVHVVQLRRTLRQRSGSASVETQDWSCRWFVSGHWRDQFYPSTREHRPVWILPYVKGPDDKPFKVMAERIFAVTR